MELFTASRKRFRQALLLPLLFLVLGSGERAHGNGLIIVDKADSFLVAKGGDGGDSPKPKGTSKA
ncbi:MAG: hypothetical protein CMI21_00450, partial [Opitutae bacterium]|nr:hypothetical protein [Opitutae bacterium]